MPRQTDVTRRQTLENVGACPANEHPKRTVPPVFRRGLQSNGTGLMLVATDMAVGRAGFRSGSGMRLALPPNSNVTIAKRLITLLAVPLLALIGLASFARLQLSEIEERSRFVAESRIVALATLGNLSRSFSEMRVNVRSYLLAGTSEQRVAARKAFDQDEQDVNRLLQQYADGLVLADRERRLLGEYQTLGREWVADAKQAMAFVDEGRPQDAVALLNGRVSEVGVRLSMVSNEWIAYDQEAARSAGEESIAVINRFRRDMFIANSAAFLLTGLLGFLTFRRIVTPIRALESSVTTIAAGDYAKAVPFVNAADETGGLARSIDVLKQGAAAMDEQRWVKAGSRD